MNLSSYLRRERRVEPLTNLAFWKRQTREKMFATNLPNQYELKQLENTLAHQEGQRVLGKEGEGQAERIQVPLLLLIHISIFAMFSHLSDEASLETGCNYGFQFIAGGVLRNQDCVYHPPNVRFMICSTTERLKYNRY